MSLNLNLKSKKKNKSSKFSEKLSAYICPMLLGSSLCYSIASELYSEYALLYTLLFFAMEYLLFRLFDKIKNIKFLGGLIYTVILIALVFLSARIIGYGIRLSGNWNSLRNWFFALDTVDNGQFMFFNGIFLSGGYFLISILYYFTQVQYRTLGVMLCILFPFVIYARRLSVMPELMVTVIIALFLAVIVHNRFIDLSQRSKNNVSFKVDLSYIISIAIFVSVTGTVTMILDKPTYTAKLERNSNYFDYARSTGSGGGEQSESLSKKSDERYGQRNFTGNTLFYFDTKGNEEEYYLRRQNYYDFNGDVWLMIIPGEEELDEDDYGEVNEQFYSKERPEYTRKDLLSCMKTLLSNTDKKSINPLNNLTTESGRVYSKDYAPEFLPAPLGTLADESGYNYQKHVTEIIIRNNAGSSSDYELDESFKFYSQNKGLYNYARELAFNSEEYVRMLNEERERLSQKLQNMIPGYSEEPDFKDEDYQKTEEDLTNIYYLLEDYYSAQNMYLGTSNVSERLKSLAEEITKDCKSDMEKALCLQDYFEDKGYIYDEEYEPDDKSIDYFVFESKTGVCTSYATAMTLMMRSLGIPSRYVEGFAAFEKSDEDTFVIRDQHAHAFVEVYIPGAGWLTFDPTVPDYKNAVQKNSEFISAELLRKLSKYLIIIIVAVFVVFSLLRDRIAEMFFRICQLFRDSKRRTLKLYANLVKLISFSAKDDYSSYTVNMLRGYIADTRGRVPEKLLQLFEKTAFGGYEPKMDEYKEAYSEYKKCYKYLRKIPRNKR